MDDHCVGEMIDGKVVLEPVLTQCRRDKHYTSVQTSKTLVLSMYKGVGEHLHQKIEARMTELGTTLLHRLQGKHVHLDERESHGGVLVLDLGDQSGGGFSIPAGEVDMGRVVFGQCNDRGPSQSSSTY